MLRLILCTAPLFVAGCANLMTIERATELPGGAKVVHLDAPQRVVVAGKNGHVCAEPSPDALQSYVSSLGLSLTGPSERAVSLTSDLAGNSAGLGLRTQAITLMRDALYRICEASRNDRLSDMQVMQMLERSQDLSLGVLAIEQLTGAVVAGQPMLVSSARSTGAAKVTSVKDATVRARADAAGAQDALVKATAARDAQKAAVISAQGTEAGARVAAADLIKTTKALNADIKLKREDLDKANDKLADARVKQAESPSPEADKAVADATQGRDAIQKTLDNETAKRDEYAKDPRMVAYDAAASALAKQQAKLASDEEELKAAKAESERATALAKALEMAPDTASAEALASVVSKGSFYTAADRAFVNDKTVNAIASATVAIVNAVVNKGHLTDTCAGILTSYAQSTGERAARIQGLLSLCREVFRANVEAYLTQARGTAPLPAPPQPLLMPSTLEYHQLPQMFPQAPREARRADVEKAR